MKEAEFIYNTVKNNGIKSTVEFQMDLIKNKKMEESRTFRKEFKELKEFTSQETRLGLIMTKKTSKYNKQETSIERQERLHSETRRSRNISLPNLKKKPCNRNRRLKVSKRPNKERGF